MPQYLIDLRDKTLNEQERIGDRSLRVIEADSQRHVASVLPDADGFYDLHCARTLVALHEQSR